MIVKRLYPYIGPEDIAEAVAGIPLGYPVRVPADITAWAYETEQPIARDGSITATFVVDRNGVLRIADRNSEHVACAGGGPVESAGEIVFELGKRGVHVIAVTNQSTGFCPEPASWIAVSKVLSDIGLPAPESFTTEFVFRKCPKCGAINVVKDGIFECAMCDTPLPLSWNFGEANP